MMEKVCVLVLVFTNETLVKLTSDGIVQVFEAETFDVSKKNVRNVSTDRRSHVLGRNSIRWPKMLVKSPSTLKSTSYRDILKRNDKKCILEVWRCNKRTHRFIRQKI